MVDREMRPKGAPLAMSHCVYLLVILTLSYLGIYRILRVLSVTSCVTGPPPMHAYILIEFTWHQCLFTCYQGHSSTLCECRLSVSCLLR